MIAQNTVQAMPRDCIASLRNKNVNARFRRIAGVFSLPQGLPAVVEGRLGPVQPGSLK